MMRWIVGWSVQSRILVVCVAAVIMYFGFTQIRKMPVEVLPEFDPPFVEIQTEALGLAAEELEGMITVSMEQDMLNWVPWLKEIRSETMTGLSSIRLFFEPGTDVFRARQMVQEQLLQAHALPSVSKPPVMLQPLSSTSRVMKIGLSSKKLSLIDLSVLARWTVQPRLMGVAGVANVSIWGQRARQVQVQVSPERLRDNGLTLHQIISTTGNALWVSPLTFLDASFPGSGGFIDTPNQRLAVRHFSPIRTPADLAKVPVEGTNMVLGDVTKLVEDHQPLIGDGIVHDGSSLLLVVERFPWASTVDVTKGVEKALQALKPGMADVAVDTQIYRPATYIQHSESNLTTALLISAVLVILALGAFLYEWRSALVGIVAIAASLAAAFLVLSLSGVGLNMMILAGIVVALAAIIDDAIVDAENIKRRLAEKAGAEGGRSYLAIILDAAHEMRTAIGYATVMTIVVVAPAYFMEGFKGALLEPFVIAFVLALIASILVALTVTPALSVFLFRNATLGTRESPIVAALRSGYDALLSRTVHASRSALVAAGVLVVLGVAVVPALHETLLPPFKDTNLLVKWRSAPGTSRPEMSRIVSRATHELRGLPGVRDVGGHVGRAIMSDKVADVNYGEIWLRIDPTADYDATLAAIRRTVDGYPGFELAVMNYLNEKAGAAEDSRPNSVVTRIYGHELEVLRKLGQEVKEAVSSVDGIANLRVEGQLKEPQVHVKVNLEAAKRYGIKPGDIRRAAATLVSGLNVGSLFEEQKVFGVVVWGVPEIRSSVSSVRNLLIDTPTGGHVRLGDVADVAVESTPTVIKREAESRYIDVVADIRGRSPGSIVDDIESRLSRVKFPLEYHAEVIGGAVAHEDDQKRMLGFSIAAAIGVFLLLQAFCGSWLMASLSFVSLAAALVGGVLAALAGGSVVTVGSLVGFLAVFGIAARNCLALIGRYQHLEQHEGVAMGAALVERGTRERFAPIVTTAATTALAFLPLAIFGSVAGLEIVQPTAIVVLGGLVTATLVNLFVVPALYARFGSSPAPELEAHPAGATR